jgi:Integrase core domain
LNIIDDHSRLQIAGDARRNTTGLDVVASFQKAFRQWGIPAGVLTDNGAVFTAKQRGEGRVALEVGLGVLGVKFDHSRPYHPQTCGKVERFHQTQKKWLAAQPAATTIRALQRQLERFAAYYNTKHAGFDGVTSHYFRKTVASGTGRHNGGFESRWLPERSLPQDTVVASAVSASVDGRSIRGSLHPIGCSLGQAARP